jgi:hypothetical protein
MKFGNLVDSWLFTAACRLLQDYKIFLMSDNKSQQGRQDDIRVDINDKSEVEYLHRQFPEKQHQQIVDAIKAAGPMREDITRYLKEHR